jgi:hypothetical protein
MSGKRFSMMVNNMDKYNIRLNLISDRVLMKVLLSYKLNPVDFSLGTFVSLTISFSHMSTELLETMPYIKKNL